MVAHLPELPVPHRSVRCGPPPARVQGPDCGPGPRSCSVASRPWPNAPPEPTLDIAPSREAEVGGARVRRALPQRNRRTVGPWCFADHIGPIPIGSDHGGIGPHPHIGLHTVTWLLSGALVHRDSLGTEQMIRPGQLNLMTAGRGVSHAEELADPPAGGLHGIQLWVAQPEATRHGPPAFEHHRELPRFGVAHGHATVLVGQVAGIASPALRDTPTVGIDLDLDPGSAVVPLDPTFEHALVVLEGAVDVDAELVVPGQLAYLSSGRDELDPDRRRGDPACWCSAARRSSRPS